MSGREIAEWKAYFIRDGQVRTLVSEGVSLTVADEMVWRVPDDD